MIRTAKPRDVRTACLKLFVEQVIHRERLTGLVVAFHWIHQQKQQLLCHRLKSEFYNFW